MKDFAKWLAFLVVVLIILPLVTIKITRPTEKKTSKKITLYIAKENKKIEISLEDYIVGVVCGEMPSSFSNEALKAQAVAARTYSIRKINAECEEHHGADLCTNYAHCQAYVDKQQAKTNWKEDYGKNMKKIENAVMATEGEYLVYNNEPAITVFHSCSNGTTEKSSDVWGGDIPYLTNVESHGDYSKKDYISEKKLSKKEFFDIIKKYDEKKADENAKLFESCKMTSGGSVDTIKLCGVDIKGTKVRQIFSLKSASFAVYEEKENIVFKVAGSGHGVGMSQYGADIMGKEGRGYKEILNHYYPGTNLTNLNK